MATKKQAVVSSLIFRFPNGPTNPEVALFQRSAKVRTYQSVYPSPRLPP